MIRTRIAALAVLLASVLSCASRGGEPTVSSSTPDAEGRGERELHRQMFARSYVPGRTGQIFVVLEKGEILLSRPDDLYRFMHGSPWEYDVEIPVLFHGDPFVVPGFFGGAAAQQDVAPTLLALAGIPIPTTMTGRALEPALAGAPGRPSIVLLVVLDGMRRDYFDRLAAKLPHLTRLRREGAFFSEAAVNYLPTVTSAGHATIATGTDPRFHGINANATFDRRTGRSEGPFPDMSPAGYLALTLADYWNVATAGRAVILVQGTTPRAAVALAGQGGCGVNGRPFVMAMFDERPAGWVTRPDCYRLPDYLADDDARAVWEAAGGWWMGHRVDSGRTLVRTALFPRFQVDALLEMIAKERVGSDEVPDLVLASFKTPDYVAHQYGPDSEELAAALEALDGELGRLLAKLADAGRYVVAVTSDHGMPPEPGEGHRRRYVEDVVEALHGRFDPSERRLILDFSDPANHQMFVSRERLAELGVHLEELAAHLESHPFVREAFTEEEIRAVRLSYR